MMDVTASELIAEVEGAVPGGDALRRLEAAAVGAARLAVVSDAVVGHFVDAARADGVPWTDIGAALGVTKQAAHQRHVARHEPDDQRLEGFDAGGRDAVHRGFEQARRLQHRFVGTEHLLLGVLDQGDSSAARVLVDHGVTADAARREVLAVVGRGDSPFEGELGLTARAYKVVELARREAHQLGAEAIDPLHLVLGLVREGRGVAATVVSTLAGDLDAVRADLLSAAS